VYCLSITLVNKWISILVLSRYCFKNTQRPGWVGSQGQISWPGYIWRDRSIYGDKTAHENKLLNATCLQGHGGVSVYRYDVLFVSISAGTITALSRFLSQWYRCWPKLTRVHCQSGDLSFRGQRSTKSLTRDLDHPDSPNDDCMWRFGRSQTTSENQYNDITDITVSPSSDERRKNCPENFIFFPENFQYLSTIRILLYKNFKSITNSCSFSFYCFLVLVFITFCLHCWVVSTAFCGLMSIVGAINVTVLTVLCTSICHCCVTFEVWYQRNTVKSTF